MIEPFILARGYIKLVMAIICAAIFIVSCSPLEQSQAQTEINQLVGNGARLPRLTGLPNGDVLMSWVQSVGENHALKFAQLKNGRIVHQGEIAKGANWFINWADFPSVAPISEKFWLAHRLVKQSGGKPYDYDVVLSLSNDAGLTWRDIGSPHRDKSAAEHGFAAIFAEGDAAGIIWLDGREYFEKKDAAKHPNKSGNFSLRYTRIHQDGSMEAEQIIDNNTCTCCWPSVAVTPSGAIAAWRGRTNAEIRDNTISHLRDGKWAAPAPLGAEGWKIDGCPVNGPALSTRGVNVAAAWFSAQGDRPRIRAAFSTDGGVSFGKAIEIDESAPLGRIGLVWSDDNTAVISWMAAANGAGKPANLALRSINKNGAMGEVKHIAEISAGHATGVPQMAATEQGVLLAWTGASPTHGINTMLVPTADLSKSDLMSRIGNLSRFAFVESPKTFIASICESPH